MKHVFTGKCPCGAQHRVSHRAKVDRTPRAPRAPRPRPSGQVKASPVVVGVIRHAVAIARSEGDCVLRFTHVEKAMRGAELTASVLFPGGAK